MFTFMRYLRGIESKNEIAFANGQAWFIANKHINKYPDILWKVIVSSGSN